MITHSKNEIHKTNPKYAQLHTVSSIPQEPKSFRSALKHTGWTQARYEELDALYQNHTWTLVPRQPDMNIIGCKWVFKTKLNADGSLHKLKACLVAKGYHQVDGIDYNETFSPVIKSSTICLVLTITLVKKLDHTPTRCEKCISSWFSQ